MPDVTVVETSNRGKAFWSGLALGVVAMLLAVFVLWLLGVINLGESETVNEASTVNVEDETSNTAIVANDGSTVDDEENLNEDETLNDVANEVAEEEEKAASASPFIVDTVLARNVDDQANPEGETSTFSKDDDRFYVVVTLANNVPEGTEIAVEWYNDGAKFSGFSTETEKSQSVTYFFANNPGEAGEYSLKILVDGKESDELKFSVQ
jgi:membrane carboxypeptidase/penicillin-binding protein PbpC